MFRFIAVGLGGILVALGIAWFFTSLLDGLPLSLDGKSAVTPISKMTLGDSMSWLFAGLSITGVGLIALALLTGLLGQSKVGTRAPQGE